MESIFEVEINPEFHPSQLPYDHVRSFSVYIPPLEQCIPSENHYFGLDELPSGSLFIEQETGKLTMPIRVFFKSLLAGNPYAYEIACTPHDCLTQCTPLGSDVLSFAVENFAIKPLADKYLSAFLTQKSTSVNYGKAVRFFTILKRLYSGLKTTEMTQDEVELYQSVKNAGIKKKEIDLLLAHMDFDLQEMESSAVFPQPDMNYINQFLIRTHKSYLNMED